MSRCPRPGAELSPGFCLLVLWFGAVNGWELLATVLSAAVIHELGHLAVLRAQGAAVTALRLSVFGAEMEIAWDRLSYPGELAAVLAGPAANLLCGLGLALLGHAVPAGAHLVLCTFNLLPIRPLDGGRALELAVSWLMGPEAGERAARWIGGIAATALAAVLVWLMVHTGGSLWLLPAAAGLAGAGARETGLFGGASASPCIKKRTPP